MGRDTSLIYFLKLVNKHVRLVYAGLPTKDETVNIRPKMLKV